ncbi:MAG: sulfite exporter TauE/SafE family protein [Cytophagales bacterium]|nr:sulfite exporter TauE/SafE family protein [Cytophagales bacterium]
MIIYSAAFLIGLMGSLHCVGMCGPLALALPVRNRTFPNVLRATLVYNSGRVVTYMLLGLVLGMLGKGFSFAGTQQYLSVATGVLMLLFLLLPKSLVQRAEQIRPVFLLNQWLKKKMGVILKKRTTDAHFVMGLLNGLLPCGLVYVALAGALATGEMIQGAVYMGAFGAGTVPMMLFVGAAGKMVSINFRQKILKAVPAFVFTIGVLFILRGLNLGIPYLSPQLRTENGTEIVNCN